MVRFFILAFAALSACASPSVTPGPAAETHYDSWGVPHIFATDLESLGYAYGHAQAEAHAELLMRLYARGRGEAARHYGADEFEADLFSARFQIPQRSGQWMADQSPETAAYLHSFAAGVNAYLAEHPDAVSAAARAVAPVTADDLLGHFQHVVIREFIAGAAMARATGMAGSNAVAIAPRRSASGAAMLYANPHLPWTGRFLFHEAQLHAGDSLSVHGVTLAGLPFVLIGFNEALGWTHTVNPHDGADLYALDLVEGGYRLDGELRALERETVSIAVAGEEQARRVLIERSTHGPVVARTDGQAFALRVAGFSSTSGVVEQYLDMARAQNLEAFQAAFSRLAMPLLNLIYADRDGHIWFADSGAFPDRPDSAFYDWDGVLDGSRSELIWTDLMAFDALPQALDPPGGFFQSTNDPPWTSTLPAVLDPNDYPDHIAPITPPQLRTQSALRLFSGDDVLTREAFRRRIASTRHWLADAVLEDLLAGAREAGDARLDAAAELLAGWDRVADPDDRAAALFTEWSSRWITRPPQGRFFQTHPMFATPFDLDAPLETPRGLADRQAAADMLGEAVAALEARWGRIDVSWDEYVSVRYAGQTLPAIMGSGWDGAFRVGFLVPDGGPGALQSLGGDSAQFIVEFTDPIRAEARLVYGNASQEGSPHRGDQLELYARDAYRTVAFDRAAIERAAVRTVTHDPGRLPAAEDR